MPITPEDVDHVARLARLDLTKEEVAGYTRELGDILEHAARVTALDTSDVPPTAHPVEMYNRFRDDTSRTCLTTAQALANAPDVEGGWFRVPRILEVEESEDDEPR